MNTINCNNTNFTAKYLRPVKVEIPKHGTTVNRTAALVELDMDKPVDFGAFYRTVNFWNEKGSSAQTKRMLDIFKESVNPEQSYKFYALTYQKKSLSDNPQFEKIQSIAAIADRGEVKEVLGIYSNPDPLIFNAKARTLNSILEEFKGTPFGVQSSEKDKKLYENNGFISEPTFPDSVMFNPNEYNPDK